jgi:hypothetical protein
MTYASDLVEDHEEETVTQARSVFCRQLLPHRHILFAYLLIHFSQPSIAGPFSISFELVYRELVRTKQW